LQLSTRCGLPLQHIQKDRSNMKLHLSDSLGKASNNIDELVLLILIAINNKNYISIEAHKNPFIDSCENGNKYHSEWKKIKKTRQILRWRRFQMKHERERIVWRTLGAIQSRTQQTRGIHISLSGTSLWTRASEHYRRHGLVVGSHRPNP